MPSQRTRRRPASSELVSGKAQRFLDQQCWLWGQDVRYPEGNLLCAHGFDRTRVPGGSSRYLMEAAEPRAVSLWAFGLAYRCAEEADAVFLGRHRFRPCLTPGGQLRDCVTFESLTLRQPSSEADRQSIHRQLPALLRWIGSYERWVIETAGSAYRETCLSRWKHPSSLEEAMTVWDTLAGQVEDIYAGDAVPALRA